MIKCDVNVCGTVSKAAVSRTNNEGKPFVAFAMNIVIPSNEGTDKTVEISVVKDVDESGLADFVIGKRVAVSGMLTFRKRGEKIYLNLSATSVSLAEIPDEDSVKGEMHFRGKTGKSVEEKTGKNGKAYIHFSGFSTEKVSDGFEFIWVRFFCFNGKREEWLQEHVAIDVKGELELSIYNDKLNISCKITEMSQYVKPPYNPNN